MWCHFNEKTISANKNNELFKAENIKTRYNVLSYRIDLYFHEYNLAVEIDENGHRGRNNDYEIKSRTITWL